MSVGHRPARILIVPMIRALAALLLRFSIQRLSGTPDRLPLEPVPLHELAFAPSSFSGSALLLSVTGLALQSCNPPS